MTIRKFHFPTIATALIVISVSCLAVDVIPDAEQWYRQGYGMVWIEEWWEKIDEVAQYFAPFVELRSLDGQTQVVDSRAHLADRIAQWKAEGGVSSAVVELRVSNVSESEVTFDVRWLDRYEDGSEEYSCGFYGAKLAGGKWQFDWWGQAVCAGEDPE